MTKPRKSLADALPPEIAEQIHPDWRKSEAEYWSARDGLLSQYQDQWIGFADGVVLVAESTPLDVFLFTQQSGKHPFELVVVMLQQQIAVRLLRLAESEPSPVTAQEQAAIVRDAREAILRVKVWQEAANRAAKPTPAPLNAVDIIELAVLTFTPRSVGALFIGGLIAWIAALLFGRGAGRLATLPAWQHLLT